MKLPCTVHLLCKAPIPGFVKTRLGAVIGPDAAAQLQSDLIQRALKTLLKANVGPLTVWCSPGIDHPYFRDLAQKFQIDLQPQPAGDLGRRMELIATYGLATSDAVVLVGNDCPIMTADYVRASLTALDSADVVFGPAEDGGYVLVGLKKMPHQLFTAMPWGTETVLHTSLTRLETLLFNYRLLPTLWDIDTVGDFRRWQSYCLSTESHYWNPIDDLDIVQ